MVKQRPPLLSLSLEDNSLHYVSTSSGKTRDCLHNNIQAATHPPTTYSSSSSQPVSSSSNNDTCQNNKHSHDNNDANGTSWNWGDTTYRREGFSIGHDYMRLEGKTVTRGSLKPESIVFLDKVLGRGAFSTVRLALWKLPSSNNQSMEEEEEEESQKTKHVAVKQCSLLDTSKDRRKMLLKELKALCLVDCPSLVKLHGAFLEQDMVTTVLEYMDAGSLQDLLVCHGSSGGGGQPRGLNEAVTASIAYQALSGLETLHNDRILHRDLKPANLLLHSDGSLKLCDFGMAALDEDSFHKTVIGTKVYMAPERLRGKHYSRPSDIWSLGLVLLHCISGLPPPWSNLRSLVDMLVTVEETDFEQEVFPDCSTEAEELLSGCLQHDPAQRIPAGLLLCSPWFLSHSLITRQDAMNLTKTVFD